MAPLLVLVASFFLFRIAGWFGFRQVRSWRASTRAASSTMFLFTGATHFTEMRQDYLAMTPEPFPKSPTLISLVGGLQIAGALGLLLRQTRHVAGRALALLLVAMFPANVNAAIKGIPFRGRPPTPLWLRTPMQALFIAAVLSSGGRESTR